VGKKAYYRTGRRGDLVIASCLFSAKGAAFTASLGHRPRIGGIPRPQALKARFALPTKNMRPVEARFQRLVIRASDSWGEASGWN